MDWVSLGLGWAGGVPSGLAANWLFSLFLRWKKRKGNYFTTTVSRKAIEFEGRIGHDTKTMANIRQIMREIYEPKAPPTSSARDSQDEI
jgi:hypothetical protein